MSEEKRELTMREVARMGGKATAAKRTADERRDQASLGGHAAAAKHDREYYAAMGKKGAAETKKRYGSEFFRNGMRKPGTPKRTQELIGQALTMADAETES